MATTKRAGWLAAAALLGAALITPSAALAVGNPPSVECAGYSYYLKIDGIGSGIIAGSYTSGTANVETNWTGQTITISGVSNGGQDFAWASTRTVSVVVAKEGSDEFFSTTGLPGMSGTVASQIQQGLSHVTFCGNAEPEVTPTPIPSPTTTPEPEITPTPTPTTTPTTSPDPEATPTPTTPPTATPEPEVTPTPAPSGTVEAETGTPRVTPPSTDAGVGSGGPTSNGNGFGLVMLALGGLVLTTLLVRPAAKRSNR